MDHLEARGQEDIIHGVAPHKSIDLEMYKGTNIPADWDISGTVGDVLMCEYADEDKDGEYVNRGGVLVNTAVSKNMWRVAKIILAGPGAGKEASPGKYVMFPNSVGVPMTKFDGHNYIFLNQERILAYVEPKNKELK